jgi:hypothetical protein
VIAEHVVLRSQRENSTETDCMRHRAESIFKVANARIVLSAYVLSLNDQTKFEFIVSVFALDFAVKPRGEDFVLWSKGREKNLYPALMTMEPDYFGLFGNQPASGACGEWLSFENSCRRTGLGSHASDPVVDTSSALNRAPPL